MRNKKVGKRLAELRQSKGFTQTQLAKKLNVTLSSIKAYEGDHRRPRDEVKVKYAKLFDLDVGELFY